jgi:hypothetical protein
MKSHPKRGPILGAALAASATLLYACGGGGSSTPTPVPTVSASALPTTAPTPTPVLQVGTVNHFNAAVTKTTQNPNTLLSQSYTILQTIEASPSGAPGPLDIHDVYAYKLLRDPGAGTVPISETVDAYRSITTSGSNQTVYSYGQNATLAQNDETSNLLGGGPYTETTNTTIRFPAAVQGLTYPLQTGATTTIALAESENIGQIDVNAANVAPPTGNVNFNETQTINSDGSFTFTKTFPTSASEVRTENSNGTGTDLATATTGTVSEAIGLPAAGVIPISVTTTPTGGTPAVLTFNAADWYPNGVPASPLSTETYKVVGPVTTLPVECDGSISLPNTVEVDESRQTFNVFGSVQTSLARIFNSNGLAVCNLTTVLTQAYDVRTGALFSTTTQNNIQVLAATTVGAASHAHAAGSLRTPGGLAH